MIIPADRVSLPPAPAAVASDTENAFMQQPSGMPGCATVALTRSRIRPGWRIISVNGFCGRFRHRRVG